MTLERPKVNNKKMFWDADELSILVQSYNGNKVDFNKLIKILKDKCGTERTKCAIKCKASSLGLKNIVDSLSWSNDELDILTQYYNSKIENTKLIIRLIKSKCGIERSVYSIRHKAGDLGLTQNTGKSREWTRQQEEKLIGMIGKYPTRIIAKKLGRSLRSIYQKCHRLNLSNYVKYDWYSMLDVSKILGINESTVHGWILNKKLNAKHHDGNKFLYHIDTKDLKTFICTYPSELTGRNVDMVQLVEILCGLNYKIDD